MFFAVLRCFGNVWLVPLTSVEQWVFWWGILHWKPKPSDFPDSPSQFLEVFEVFLDRTNCHTPDRQTHTDTDKQTTWPSKKGFVMFCDVLWCVLKQDSPISVFLFRSVQHPDLLSRRVSWIGKYLVDDDLLVIFRDFPGFCDDSLTHRIHVCYIW